MKEKTIVYCLDSVYDKILLEKNFTFWIALQYQK